MGQNPVSFSSRTECIKAADEPNARQSSAFTLLREDQLHRMELTTSIEPDPLRCVPVLGDSLLH